MVLQVLFNSLTHRTIMDYKITEYLNEKGGP